ncbi:MAG: helix-turn-helix domain-containing protein [Ruminococcaceae bacterium]|nr:helix-turn-helix domain-containing protein [Oscillospiraceae bacterium]
MNGLKQRAPAYQRENCGKHYECRYGWHDDYAVSPHLHRFSEVLYVQSGVMTMYLDGQKQKIHAGEAVFILPHAVHSYTAETANRCLCVVCSNDFLPCLFETLGDRVPNTPVFSARAIAATFSAISETAADDGVRFMALLNTVADAFVKQVTLVPKKKGERNPLYREVLTYIDENYHRELTLSAVAKALGYHEKYLSALVGSMGDMNFRTLLASRRIEAACGLLKEADSGRTIAEVAHEVGFSSINTFNRVFKAFCGVTPREFRRGT